MGREDNPIRILAAILRSFREHRELGHSYFIFPSAGQPLASRLSQHSRSRFRGGSFAFISLLPLLLAPFTAQEKPALSGFKNSNGGRTWLLRNTKNIFSCFSVRLENSDYIRNTFLSGSIFFFFFFVQSWRNPTIDP